MKKIKHVLISLTLITLILHWFKANQYRDPTTVMEAVNVDMDI